MVANNARHTALMTLRRSLPNNLATKIVKTSSANHRYNEKLKKLLEYKSSNQLSEDLPFELKLKIRDL